MSKFVYAAFLLLALFSITQHGHAQKKPNIVVIFADDMGYMDAGFTGSKIFETPVIDGLAKKGMVFTHAYSGGANCAPSRAALMSGQYSPRHGVFAVGSMTRGPAEHRRLTAVENNTSLPGRIVTVAEALKAQGYATGLFGKWHLGYDNESHPTAQGFDVWEDPRHPNPNTKRDDPTDPKAIFTITNSAINFMKSNRDKPFFTFLSHHAVHVALEARPETINKFKSKNLDRVQTHYGAMIYDLDESVGLVTAFLEEAGLADNTLVIFTSDNGGAKFALQEPLRGNKGAFYEGGVRVPFIAYWPKKIKPSVQHTPIINLDLYSTFLALAGGQVRSDLDGESLLPILQGTAKATKRDKIFWHFPGYLHTPVTRGRDSIFRTRPVSVISKDDWKLLLYHEEWILDGGQSKIDENHAVELYNLREDEGERINLATTNKKKRDELLNDLLEWLKETKAPMPTVNQEYKEVKEETLSPTAIKRAQVVANRVELSSEQIPKVAKIYHHTIAAHAKVKESDMKPAEGRKATQAINAKRDKELRQVLTNEQWEKLLESRKK